MEKLRDIKGVVEVHDNSLTVLIVTVVAVLLLAAVAGYFMKRKMRKKRRFRKTAKELARERIEAIDFDDPKSVAYTFIEDVGQFVDEQRKSQYETLVKALEPYKYKKEVPPLDAGLKEKIRKFIKEIRWEV